MRIQLLGWESKGLRCPDHKISFQIGGNIAPVSLIQMPNGTGKTTTLQMLAATLSGEASKWTTDKIAQFKRPNDSVENGKFLVNLLADDAQISIELMLDFLSDRALYRTTTSGSGGVVKGYKPPPHLRKFLEEEFIRLFIFDGEFAENLLDPSKSEADRAIDALCQLYLIDEVKAQVDRFWKTSTKDKSVKTEKGLNQYRSKETTLEARIKKFKDAKTQLDTQLITVNAEIDRLSSEIKSHIGSESNLREQFKEATAAENVATELVKETVGSLMKQMRQPQNLHRAFGGGLLDLKSGSDRLKLPENTSRQFFIELADEERCICDRPIDAEIKEIILTKAEGYLGQDAAGVLNSIKSDVESLVDPTDANSYDDISECVSTLTGHIKDRNLANQLTQNIENKMVSQGDTQLEKMRNDLKEAEDNKYKIEGMLSKINLPASEVEDETPDTYSLSSLQKQLNEVKNRIAEITNTIEIRSQVHTIQDVLQKSHLYAQENIKQAIVASCNQTLEDVLAEDVLQIKSIDRSLQLKHQEGASVGQTLAVGYTFLTSVLSRGKHQFPLVVDSPANPLDGYKRRKVGELIPKLCDQFIGFTINTERQDFVTALDKQLATDSREILYFTMFRKTGGTEYLMKGLPADGVEESRNGYLIKGEEYFNNFNMAEEID